MSEAIAEPATPSRGSRTANTGPELTLYYSPGCAYCAEVQRIAARLGVELSLRNVRESDHDSTLRRVQGSGKVPVLLIESENGAEWIPESLNIIDTLERTTARKEGREARTLPLRIRVWGLRLAPLALLGVSTALEGRWKAAALVLAAGLGVVRFIPPSGTSRRRPPA